MASTTRRPDFAGRLGALLAAGQCPNRPSRHQLEEPSRHAPLAGRGGKDEIGRQSKRVSAMWRRIERFTDQNLRRAIGLRFEAFVDEAFQVVRWSAIVGFARFLDIRYPGPVFALLYWVLATLLFGYLASRFLLRPEIRLFPEGALRWQRLVQSAFNFLLCVVVFLAVLGSIATVVDRLADYRLIQ
jgi:hypothetical protein